MINLYTRKKTCSMQNYQTQTSLPASHIPSRPTITHANASGQQQSGNGSQVSVTQVWQDVVK